MTAKQNRMKPRSTGVLHGQPKLKGSRGIKSAPDLTSPGGKCLDLGREDSLTTPWTCFQLSAAQEKVRVRAPPPWTPVSPPGLHSSMPRGTLRGSPRGSPHNPAELAALTFVLTRGVPSTCPGSHRSSVSSCHPGAHGAEGSLGTSLHTGNPHSQAHSTTFPRCPSTP